MWLRCTERTKKNEWKKVFDNDSGMICGLADTDLWYTFRSLWIGRMFILITEICYWLYNLAISPIDVCYPVTAYSWQYYWIMRSTRNHTNQQVASLAPLRNIDQRMADWPIIDYRRWSRRKIMILLLRTDSCLNTVIDNVHLSSRLFRRLALSYRLMVDSITYRTSHSSSTILRWHVPPRLRNSVCCCPHRYYCSHC